MLECVAKSIDLVLDISEDSFAWHGVGKVRHLLPMR